MNFVVVAEGTDEMGHSWEERELLARVPKDRQGALERLVMRLARRFSLDASIVAFRRPRSKLLGYVGQPSLRDILTDADHLSQVLNTTLQPAHPELRTHGACGVLVVADEDKEELVKATLAMAIAYVPGNRVAGVVCRPEFEALLFDKAALEAVIGCRPCTVRIPPLAEIQAGAKEALKKCLAQAGHTGSVTAAVKAAIVERLTDRFLDGPSMTELRTAVQALNHACGNRE